MAASTDKSRILSLVFTDLAGSTALKMEKGDRAAGDLISQHRAHVERFASEADGRIMDWAGDGCFLTFDVPSAAVLFALRLQTAHAADSSLPSVRVGVHMGEVTEKATANGSAPRVEGLAVDLASRIQSLARPGQVLMSTVVFDNVRQRLRSHDLGAEIAWRAHGAYELKGFEGIVNICEAGIERISPLSPPEGSDKAHRAVTPGEEDTLGWRPAVGLSVPGREQWALDQKLGEGGFGEVWLAVHTKTKAKRVFKFCFEPERVRGLKREVVLFRLLKETLGKREDIAQIIDWDFDKPPYFIESEYTEAGDLGAWAEAKGGLEQTPLGTRLELVSQVAVALGAAHSVGVLHKDLKPSNVLVSEPPNDPIPRATLTDFGIGLITDRQALLAKGITALGLTETLSSSISSASGLGTRMYMAPEVIEGKPATTLSDVYALGVVLYQIVIGDFRHALAPGWERNIHDPLLVEDIAACVDGNPERRIAGASELAARLRSLDTRRAMRETEAQNQRAVEKARRRRRQFSVASAIGISLTVIAGLVAFRENQRADAWAQLAQREQEARLEADKMRAAAEYGQYLADLRLIEHDVSSGNIVRAGVRLDRTIPRLRMWEWGYFVNKAFPQQAELAVAGTAEGRALTAEAQWLGAKAQVVATIPAHSTTVYTLDFSPDGSRLATRSLGGDVSIWDSTTFQRVAAFGKELEGTYSTVARFDSSGTLLAVDLGRDVYVYELASRRRIAQLTVTGQSVLRLAFSPDASLLLVCDVTQTVSVWDWRNGRELWSRKIPEGFAPTNLGVAAWFGFEAGSNNLILPRDRTTVEVYAPETGEVIRTVRLAVPDGFHPAALPALHDRMTFYNPRDKNFLRVELSSGAPVGEPWSGPAGSGLVAIESSRDGTFVAIRNDSSTIRLFDTGRRDSHLAGAMPAIEGISGPTGGQGLAISPAGNLIAVPQNDGTLTFFAPARDETAKHTFAHADSVSTARFMGSDDELVTASFDGTLRIWDLGNARLRRELKAHRDGITSLFPSPDHTRWITYSYDGTQGFWNLENADPLFSSPTGASGNYAGGLRGPMIRISRMLPPDGVFSPKGDRFILSTSAGSALIFDATSFQQLHALGGHKGRLSAVAFSPDGALAMTHDQETAARIWDANTGTLRHVMDAGSPFVCAAFSPDSKMMVATHPDGRVTVWDTTSGEKAEDFKAHAATAMTATFDSSGRYVLTSSTDGTAAVWDAEDYTLEARMVGHSGFVLGARFSPAGDRVLTLGFDGTARIWDLQGNEMLTIKTGETIMFGTWSPTGKRVAVATQEGHILIYDSIPAAELAIAGDPSAPLRDRVASWRKR